MRKFKDYFTIILICSIIFGLFAAHILLPDGSLSLSERRKLAQMPDLTADALLSGELSSELEEYALDQFPLRELFRRFHSFVRLDIFRQQDVNGYRIENGHIFKQESPLDETQLLYGANLINRLCETLLSDADVYFSVVPDKNYFLGNNGSEFDYDRLVDIMNENLIDVEYIDIFNTLSLDDYYRTDSHWSQDKIFDTAMALADGMGIAELMTPEGDYEKHELSPFYGVYYGQAALSSDADTLVYCVSDFTDATTVTGIEGTSSELVYPVDRFYGLDGYDLFLSGAQSVLTLECPDARSDRELIIFRDSFGSSIAPLFTGAYSKITLIDLRYINSSFIEDYVTFADQDVLFLYSASMLNSSMLMR